MLKARLLSICLVSFACQSNSDTRTVSGRLDTSQFALMKDGAEVVAAAVSGRTHRAPIRSDGTFTMELLVGERYQLRFANLTDSEGVYDAFAVLSVDGGSRRTFQVMEGPAFDLGRVGRVGTVTSSLRAFTGGHDDEDDEEDDGDTEDDADDDDDTEDADSTDGDSDSTDEDSDSNDADSDQDDDDVDQVCDEEGGMDMEDVEAENDPADGMCACSDDSDSEGDSDSDDGTDTDDGDSDSDSDSDTDSDGTDDDTDDDEDSCGSDDHDDDLDDECEEPAPPDGGENNPPVPCTTNEDCAGGVCTEGVCVGV